MTGFKERLKRALSSRRRPNAVNSDLPPAAPPPPALDPAIAKRLKVPLLQKATERDEWREIEAGFAQLADGGLWPSLLDRLRGVDQSRQQFASGKRYFDCALAGAISPVTRHLKDGPPRLEEALAALPVLEAVHAADARDYMPAVILGRTLIEIGWAVRGDSPPAAVPKASAEAAGRYFARAETVLDAFDPIEQNSPMIADARYRLAPGVVDGVDFLRDWYEDWADLDPSNPHMLMTHSRFLMPAWYGDYDEIEREARAAMSRAADGLGAGAYAFFWRAPLEADPAAVAQCDAKLFLQGAHETLSVTMSSHLANRFAALLYRISHGASDEDRVSTPEAENNRQRFGDGYKHLLRRHLREVQAPLWPYDNDGIQAAIAAGFKDELEAGLAVAPGEAGLTTTVPSND